MLAPRGDGIRLVEANCPRHEVPEALHVGLAEDPRRPALVRERDRAPVDRPAREHRVDVALVRLLRASEPESFTVDVVEEIGMRIAGDPDLRRVEVLHRLDPGEQPRRRVLEHRLRRVTQERATDELVAVGDRDELGTGFVGDVRDRAGERRMLDEAGDEELLATADIRSHVDGELRVASEQVF